MRRGIIGLALGVLLPACDTDGRQGADAGSACDAPTLIAQCPAGTTAALGAQADEACGGGSVVVQDAEGAAAGQCLGLAGCRVLCQFAVPCRCGVASLSAQGVACAPCAGAASCGDGVCAGGEGPETCPVDCGPRCEPDERRCDGVILEACDLQGRWERLPCPAGEICVAAAGGEARCEDDPRVIGGGDAGVADGGAPSPSGRVLPGEGTWPSVVDGLTGETPPDGFMIERYTIPLTGGRVRNERTDFARSVQEVGTCFEYRLGVEPDTIECLGPAGWFAASLQGYPLPPTPGLDFEPEPFCAAWLQCGGSPIDDCAMFVADQRARIGDLRLNCIAASIPADCLTVAGLGCDQRVRLPYPEDTRFMRGQVRRAGARLVGILPDQRGAARVDRETAEVLRLEAPGELVLSQLATSLDGEVAAFVGQAGVDTAIVTWRPATQERRATLARSGGGYRRLALNPDGQVLATIAFGTRDPHTDAAVVLHNLAEEERIFTILPEEGDQLGDQLAFSPDGVHLAVSVQPRHRIEIWDLVARERRQTLETDGRTPVTALGFSPDGRILAAVHGALHLWEVASGQRLQTADLIQHPVSSPTFQPDGRRGLIGGGAPTRVDFVLLGP